MLQHSKTVSLDACLFAQGSRSDDTVFEMSFETIAENSLLEGEK